MCACSIRLQCVACEFQFGRSDLMIFFAVPFVNRFQPKKSYRVSFNSRETCPCRVIRNLISPIFLYLTADPGGPGICAFILTLFSFLLILATFPLSLCFSVKVTYIFTFNLMIRDYRILILLSYGNKFSTNSCRTILYDFSFLSCRHLSLASFPNSISASSPSMI